MPLPAPLQFAAPGHINTVAGLAVCLSGISGSSCLVVKSVLLAGLAHAVRQGLEEANVVLSAVNMALTGVELQICTSAALGAAKAVAGCSCVLRATELASQGKILKPGILELWSRAIVQQQPSRRPSLCRLDPARLCFVATSDVGRIRLYFQSPHGRGHLCSIVFDGIRKSPHGRGQSPHGRGQNPHGRGQSGGQGPLQGYIHVHWQALQGMQSATSKQSAKHKKSSKNHTYLPTLLICWFQNGCWLLQLRGRTQR